MMVIALLPAIIVIIVIQLYSVEKAFLNCYLPILLLLPQIFTFHISRIPEINFSQAAILPLFVCFLFQKGYLWKYSLCDFLMIAYLLVCCYSEYIEKGRGSFGFEFTNLMTKAFMPYALSKVLIHRNNLTISFAKKIVLFIFIDVIISLYETKMTVNPWGRFFQIFFPDQGWDLVPLIRYGFTRISGPFLQPILFCVGIGIALLLHYWLVKNKFWEYRFKYIPTFGISKGFIIGFILLMGCFLTLARGPWAATFLSALLMGVGFSKHPWKSFFFRTLLFIVISLFIYQIYDYYSEVGQERTVDEPEYTIAYRTVLLTKYYDVIAEKIWFGWGIGGWPVLAGSRSIDNQYIVLLLSHGIFAFILFLVIIFWTLFRLFLRGFSMRLDFIADRSLAMTFFCIILSMVLNFMGVFMGMQTANLFFIMIGWAEGYLHSIPLDQKKWQLIANPKQQRRINLPSPSPNFEKP